MARPETKASISASSLSRISSTANREMMFSARISEGPGAPASSSITANADRSISRFCGTSSPQRNRHHQSRPPLNGFPSFLVRGKCVDLREQLPYVIAGRHSDRRDELIYGGTRGGVGVSLARSLRQGGNRAGEGPPFPLTLQALGGRLMHAHDLRCPSLREARLVAQLSQFARV